MGGGEVEWTGFVLSLGSKLCLGAKLGCYLSRMNRGGGRQGCRFIGCSFHSYCLLLASTYCSDFAVLMMFVMLHSIPSFATASTSFFTFNCLPFYVIPLLSFSLRHSPSFFTPLLRLPFVGPHSYVHRQNSDSSERRPPSSSPSSLPRSSTASAPRSTTSSWSTASTDSASCGNTRGTSASSSE